MSEFSPSQKRALLALEGNNNVFLTGEAGSGKSYVVRHFVANRSDKTFPVLASTGAASVLVNGRTFHSFMGLGIMDGGVEATVEKALKDKRLIKRLQKIEGFVLDEVSMISAPTLKAAETICRLARERQSEPWGGLRVVAVGDFAQLPPVQRGYGPRAWAFMDPIWRDSEFVPVLLEQNMRIEDQEFLRVLNFIRTGVVNQQVTDFLNERMRPVEKGFSGTRLFPRRNQTDAFNLKELDKIPAELKVFKSVYSGRDRAVQQLKRYATLPEELQLKQGCLVMLRQNDPRNRWVNGSTGTVEKMEDEELWIRLLNGRLVKVEKATFSLLNAEGVAQAAVTNFPVSLAYAATIHKAQGATLDRMVVNLKSLWEPGQAYVALSRVVHSKELYVEDWNPSSIKADAIVSKYYDYIRKKQASTTC